VDRSIQVTLTPGRLQVAYEVSLSELTLTQDLRALIGRMPGGDRSSWLARYAQVTGPLNAKGLLVTVDGRPVSLNGQKHDLVVEEHPRYTFHFEAAIPNQGRLSVRDRNYVSSEGTSRLAVRGSGGVAVSGDDLPQDVEQIPIQPIWQLSDAEERRTKQVEVGFQSTKKLTWFKKGSGTVVRSTLGAVPATVPDPFLNHAEKPTGPTPSKAIDHGQDASATASVRPADRLIRFSELLDETRKLPLIFLALIALALGGAHAIQPGHGKTLVTAIALGPQTRFYQPALLGLATTLTHMGSVLLIALALWFTGATQVGTVHKELTRVAGFVIAAAGLWRIGRHLGGYGEHELEQQGTVGRSNLEILGLGVAGGLVPCWDAVGLVVLAAALGRLAEGVALVFIFSAGMAAVLIAVGLLAWKFKSSAVSLVGSSEWQRRLGLACGVILSTLGLYLFLQA